MNKPLIVTDLKNDNIDFLINCSGMIINSSEYSVFNSTTFNYDELIEVIDYINSHNYQGTLILNCDRIIEENEVNSLYEYLEKIWNKFTYILYSDYSLYTFARIKNQINKLIYNPKTLVSSINEVKAIDTKTFISNELNYNQIKDIVSSCKNKVCLECFGFHQIFYSKRPLLSLYNDFIEKDVLKSNVLYDLKEELRSDLYKIMESIHGTFIYTPYVYLLLDELSELKNLFVIYLNSAFLATDLIKNIYVLYQEYLETSNDAIKKRIELLLENNCIEFNRGFLDKKSVLLKGDKDE